MKAYVQVYTGEGKGKTNAAIGLAISAIGAGKKVLFLQFTYLTEFNLRNRGQAILYHQRRDEEQGRTR